MRNDEHWRPFEGRYPDGMPLVGAVSRFSSDERQKIRFPWCVHLTVHFDAADERGYPTAAEEGVLGEFSAALLALLRGRVAVVEEAELTGKSAREFWWYVADPDSVQALLARYADQPSLFRSFDYDIALDVDRRQLERFAES